MHVMPDVADLFERVAVRAASENASLPARITSAEIAQANARLGFLLHPLLARMYTEVADGGFGPECSLLPLLGPGRSVVSEYLKLRERSAREQYPRWPAGVVPILDWGCAMYAAVDCRDPGGQVLMFDPNPYGGGAWDTTWFLDAASLADWLEAWLAGTAWYYEHVMNSETPVEPQPWTQAAHRLAPTS